MHSNVRFFNQSFNNKSAAINTGSVVEVIFSINYFKAMLALCEVMKTNVKLSFKEPTQPLLVASVPTGSSIQCLEAKLVISTFPNSNAPTESTQAPSQMFSRLPVPIMNQMPAAAGM